MAGRLAYRVKSLDDVPESARDLYEEGEDGFTLQVDDLAGAEEVGGLRKSLERLKRELAQAKSGPKTSTEDLDELERLRKAEREREDLEAQSKGEWDKLKARADKEIADLQKEIATLKEQGSARDSMVVRNALNASIAEHVSPEQIRAVGALLREDNRFGVEWTENGPQVVALDELHGNRPIGEFLGEWAKGDGAKPFLPGTKGGSGGPGTTKGGSGKSWGDKKFSEMTPEEQIEFTEQKYGEGAVA